MGMARPRVEPKSGARPPANNCRARRGRGQPRAAALGNAFLRERRCRASDRRYLCLYVLALVSACAARPRPRWPMPFADGFESRQGDPGCWLTVLAQVGAGRRHFAGYELRPSPSGSHDWVILFEGGGSCDDLTLPCVDRGTAPDHHAGAAQRRWRRCSTAASSTPTLRSIRTSPTPTWCSSTTVPATSGAGDDDPPRHQRHAGMRCERQHLRLVLSGRLNARAAIESLQRDHGLRDDGTSACCSGTSAGGFGLSANAEAMTRHRCRPSPHDGLRFVIDGGYVLTAGTNLGTSSAPARSRRSTSSRRRTAAFWERHYRNGLVSAIAANGPRSGPVQLGRSTSTTGPVPGWPEAAAAEQH